MPPREVLVMAMTRMKSGICTAGFLTEPHPDSHLCWVRPVKRFGTLLLDDMRDQEGRVVQIGDVVTLNLLQPKVDTPRPEDRLTDFIDQPIRMIRQLTEQKRADFLAHHSDKKPAAVLQQQARSLSLLKPQEVWARFTQDTYSGTH